MASRFETRPWGMPTYQETEIIEDSLEENVGRLADYLADGAPDTVEIGSVIPSIRIGIRYTLLLGRETEKDGETVNETYQVDGKIFETLHSSVCQWNDKQKKENEEFLGTVMAIKDYVRDPFNWPPPAYNERPN